MRRKIYFLLLFLFYAFFISAQNTDSLVAVVEKMPEDSTKIKGYLQIARQYDFVDFPKNKTYLFKGNSLAKKLNLLKWQPLFEYNLGRAMVNTGLMDSALLYFDLAAAKFQQLGQKDKMSDVWSKKAYAYNRMGKNDETVAAYFQGIKIAEEIKDELRVAILYNGLAHSFATQRKGKEGVVYLEKAIEIQKRLKDNLALAESLKTMGDICDQTKDYEKSLKYHSEAIEILKNENNQMSMISSLNSRGNTYKHMKRWKEALADYQTCLEFLEKAGVLVNVSATCNNIGEVYGLMGDYRQSIYYLLKCKRGLEEQKNLQAYPENLLHLATAYAGLGKFDSAYITHKLAYKMTDSLLNIENNAQIEELKTKYETEKKEEQITQQSEIIRLQNRNAGFLIGGLLLSIAAGLGLYSLTRKLRRRNQEKEFLIKEVHHRVKNNLQVISSLLQLQSRYIKDEVALDAVKEGQNRVEAMGLIHQKLYMGESLATIDIREYIQGLGDMLLDAFGVEDDRVKMEYAISNLQLDVDTAIPLGLIINELVTNSMKYAFPKSQKGTITIALSKNAQGKLSLRVSDNGAGISQGIEGKFSTSFGNNLIEILSKKLKGKPQITNSSQGYSTLIEFDCL